jgi:betaine-aldehyde dehydrogenase
MSKTAKIPGLDHLLPQGTQFVDGRFGNGSGETIPDIFPATGEAFLDIPFAADADIEAAVAAAARGHETWRRTPPRERARVLARAADLLRQRNDEIARIETLDTGKAIQETLVTDVVSAADCLDYFAGHAATMTGEHVAFSGALGDFGYTIREPLGVCLGIAAWNYPLQMAAWKSAPALACGNSFILKPSETTPLSALALARAYKDAGLPDGVFNVVQGDGAVGARLVAHPGVAKISMTGSTPTGARILRTAADGIKKVTLELGGKSPLVVFADADLDAAVSGAMLANFYSTGQVCSNGTRVFVEKKIEAEFLARLIARTAAIRVGDPFDPQTQMGPLVSAAHLRKVSAWREAARSQAECLYDAGVPRIQGFGNGYWIGPSIWRPKDDNQPMAREEIFGPLLSLFSFEEEDEALARANDTPYGLAAGVFTRDLARAHRMVAGLQAGTTWINHFNVTPVELPFGGFRQSGLGTENGKWALESYTRVKSVYVAVNPPFAPY